LFVQSAEIDQAMRGMVFHLVPFLVAYRDTAATMLAEVNSLISAREDMAVPRDVSPEAAELYAAMAGVPLREQRRIMECLDIMRGWYDNGLVDITRAQSVAIYVGPQVTANDTSPPVVSRSPLSLVVNN
jgi:hypothetical protein